MCCHESEPGVYDLVRDIFLAGAVTCFLLAMHRIAQGVLLTGRVAAYDTLVDAYTPQEREALIHRIKRDSERY